MKINSGTLSKINEFARIPLLLGFLLKQLVIQKSFIKKNIEPELCHFSNTNDGSLNEKDFRKIRSYYALGVPAILGTAFAVLRGKKLLRKERICLSFLGGISGLLDDFFDDLKKSASHLEAFILHPENLAAANTSENLLKVFYLKGLQFANNPDKIKQQAFSVFTSQKQSLQQQEAEKGRKSLKNLCFLKGGNSFIYYRLCLDNTLGNEERELIFQLGGLMQLGNDIFDVYKDSQQGIHTLATDTKDVRCLKNLFEKELGITAHLAYKTQFQNKNIIAFLRFLYYGLARVFVCMEQFQLLQDKSNGIFNPELYTRKELICDMEKPGNHWKAIKYYLLYARMLKSQKK